ncbi:MdtA/MuxA family multidrug efflux RND transporter periplasmic adaptor subunit [Acinetobacter calcoaceticus]|uniref:MdtA/MuxA family multidrug efflux RND transporter periplasmic adaptor subunit n=1 Tax=Acinetobacter calcoaceticus TaxID=471 RepID=UPI0019002E1D|nr:MdtA/MuxA family multidrug efflux RND transporter periplasmic adaptor subunit [Acinetobacter calcoaceticus]MBJ9720908.1 MdtA/MuxA family multidrug efflux RND transporter periplasmic adaptor subunit [Acinetobacter calcoaceticus]
MNDISEPNKVIKKPSKTKSFLSYIVLFLILFLVGFGIWHLTHQPLKSSQSASSGKRGKSGHLGGGNSSTVVGTSKVVQQDVQQTIQALGTVTSTNTIIVHPLINGTLMQIYFKEGSFVHKGQLLALIDDRAPKASLLQAQGQLLKDQALLRNAKLDMQRYAQLWKQDSIAKQQYDTQASLVKQYEGVLKTDQAAVENAKLQLSYTRIVSPVDGRIGLRQVDVGNMVTTSDANGIANITQFKNISVVFAVPEQYLTQLMQIMDNSNQNIKVEAWDRQNTQKLADGKLVALDNQVNINTGTINIKASFDNQNQHLFPNQFVNVRMSLGNIANAMIVPTVALQLGANGSFVYKVNSDQTVSAVNVQTGAVVGDNTVITSGALTVNDAVVTDGVDKLKDGAKISVGTGHHQGSGQAADTQGGSGGHRYHQNAQGSTPETNSSQNTGQHQWQHHREQASASGAVAASQPSAQTAQ